MLLEKWSECQDISGSVLINAFQSALFIQFLVRDAMYWDTENKQNVKVPENVANLDALVVLKCIG